MNQKGNRFQFSLTGSSLKLLAIATMLIDHIGASILEPLIAANNAHTIVSPFVTGLQLDYVLLERMDFIFRSIQQTFDICSVTPDRHHHNNARKYIILRKTCCRNCIISCTSEQNRHDKKCDHKQNGT